MGTKSVTANAQPDDRRANLFERSKRFLKDVRNEMRKVTSPSRKEVQATTGVVIITVFIFGLYFFLVDHGVSFVVDRILAWGKQ